MGYVWAEVCMRYDRRHSLKSSRTSRKREESIELPVKSRRAEVDLERRHTYLDRQSGVLYRDEGDARLFIRLYVLAACILQFSGGLHARSL